MKRLRKSLLVAAMILTTSYAVNGQATEQQELLAAKQMDIIAALDARNFKAAKEVIAEFLPLLKKEQKLLLKQIAVFKKKDGDEGTATALENRYTKRGDLYENLKKVLSVSPSALRVRSGIVSKDLRSFDFSGAPVTGSLAKNN